MVYSAVCNTCVYTFLYPRGKTYRGTYFLYLYRAHMHPKDSTWNVRYQNGQPCLQRVKICLVYHALWVPLYWTPRYDSQFNLLNESFLSFENNNCYIILSFVCHGGKRYELKIIVRYGLVYKVAKWTVLKLFLLIAHQIISLVINRI